MSAQLKEIEQTRAAGRFARPRQASALGDGVNGAGLTGIRPADKSDFRPHIGRKLRRCGSTEK
jgi:hypothetical protein